MHWVIFFDHPPPEVIESCSAISIKWYIVMSLPWHKRVWVPVTLVFQFDIGIPSMTKCCNQHDRCYDTCGREKHDCDEQFQDCLETICRNVQRTLGLSQSVQGNRQNCLCRFVYNYPYNMLFNRQWYTHILESDIMISVVIIVISVTVIKSS